MTVTAASTLSPSDRFLVGGTEVTVLRDKEPYTDLFGRQMFRFWCQRSDTGAEGWMEFGPSGIVHDVVRAR